MRYKYDVISKTKEKGVIIKAPKLASLIKKEVSLGKWNIYDGGVDGKNTAKLSYKGKNWEYGEHMFIYGSKKEFEHLEQLISKWVKVNPRIFN